MYYFYIIKEALLLVAQPFWMRLCKRGFDFTKLIIGWLYFIERFSIDCHKTKPINNRHKQQTQTTTTQQTERRSEPNRTRRNHD